MTDFERALVKAFNRAFGQIGTGIAYRRKQHRFSSQFLDIIVDNPYLGIEAKSLKTKHNNKLYFSQHFSEVDDGHQVERIDDFLKKSDRIGLLAVELRRGVGTPKQAFFIEWGIVNQLYMDDRVGIPLESLHGRGGTMQIPRQGGEYHITGDVLNWIIG